MVCERLLPKLLKAEDKVSRRRNKRHLGYKTTIWILATCLSDRFFRILKYQFELRADGGVY